MLMLIQTNPSMNDENDENSEFNPNLMLEKLMEEKLLEHMKGEIPSVIEAVPSTMYHLLLRQSEMHFANTLKA